jgi:hypothetical protein
MDVFYIWSQCDEFGHAFRKAFSWRFPWTALLTFTRSPCARFSCRAPVLEYSPAARVTQVWVRDNARENFLYSNLPHCSRYQPDHMHSACARVCCTLSLMTDYLQQCWSGSATTSFPRDRKLERWKGEILLSLFEPQVHDFIVNRTATKKIKCRTRARTKYEQQREIYIVMYHTYQSIPDDLDRKHLREYRDKNSYQQKSWITLVLNNISRE